MKRKIIRKIGDSVCPNLSQTQSCNTQPCPKTCSNNDVIPCPNNDCPSGSYSETCSNCTYNCRAQQLTCDCLNERQINLYTSLNNVNKTNRNVSNCNGGLCRHNCFYNPTTGLWTC